MLIGTFGCFAQTATDYTELYELSGANGLSDKLSDNTRNVLREFRIDVENPESMINLNGFELIKKLIASALDNVKSPLFALSTISAVSVVYAVLFGTAPKPIDGKYDIRSYILPSICAVTVALSLTDIITDTANAVSSCNVFMTSFIPVYAGILISGGHTATGGGYSSLMFAVSQIFCTVADNLLIPLCYSALISSVGTAFSDICERICGIIKKASITLLTFGMTVFTFILGLQTSISSVSDSIGIKTAKAAIGTFIPIVGSSLSDSLSAILGSMALLKSTVGVYSMICLVIMIVPVLTDILLWKAALGLLGVVTQTTGATGASKLLSAISGLLTVLMCILLCCAAAYIISVALTLSVGG